MIYYVDSVSGNDSNDGLSIASPLKSFDKFKTTSSYCVLKHGDIIKVKRGSEFNKSPIRFYTQNTNRTLYNPVVMTTYGNGAKPKFSAYNVLPKTSITYTNNQIYRVDLSTLSEGSNLDNYNVGFIYDKLNDKIYAKRKFTQEALTDNMDFYVNDNYLYIKINDIESIPDTLYLPIDEIPFVCDSNLIIDGMEFTLTGRHGCATMVFDGCDNIEIRNCKFSKIGGSVLTGREDNLRYGNGFEMYEAGKDVCVHHCVFEDIYDTGVTFQGDHSNFENISFDYNLFVRCGYPFEGWLNGGTGAINCEFSHNICINSGYSHKENAGFDVFYAPISNVSNCEIRIENNVFFNAKKGILYIPDIDGADITLNGNKYYDYDNKYILNEALYKFSNHTDYVNATHQDTSSKFIVIESKHKGKQLEETLLATALNTETSTIKFESEPSSLVGNGGSVIEVQAEYGVEILAKNIVILNNGMLALRVKFKATTNLSAYADVIRIILPTNTMHDQNLSDKVYATRSCDKFINLKITESMSKDNQIDVSGLLIFNS